MEPPFSPTILKIAREVISKPKRTFTRPTEVCLEEWWLSKPESGDGLAVHGRPIENRKCDNAQRVSHSAPAKRRYASREFHSTNIVKRYTSTTLETSDGFMVSLCGFINKSRTQENGFSSEVCRDFIFGFPYNWDDYATSVVEKSSQNNLKESTESFLPAALDAYNGAKLHGLVLSLSDTERDLFNKEVYDTIIGMMSEHPIDEMEVQPLDSISSQVDVDVKTPESRTTRSSEKRHHSISSQVDVDVKTP